MREIEGSVSGTATGRAATLTVLTAPSLDQVMVHIIERKINYIVTVDAS